VILDQRSMSSSARGRASASARGSLIARGLALLLLCSTLFAWFPATANAAQEPVAGEPLTVGVSIAPLAYWVSGVAGKHAQVSVLLRAGSDPHAFAPSLDTMRELSAARLYVSAGLVSESKWLAKLTNLAPELRVLQLADSRQSPHFWLSPLAALVAIGEIEQALIDIDPANQHDYQHNAKQLRAEIQQLHTQLLDLFSDLGSQRRFLVTHPAWNQFALDYSLEQLVVEEQGKSLTVRKLVATLERARELNIKKVYSELAHPSKEALRLSEQLDAEIVPLNPLSRDWAASLLQAAKAIKAGLR